VFLILALLAIEFLVFSLLIIPRCSSDVVYKLALPPLPLLPHTPLTLCTLALSYLPFGMCLNSCYIAIFGFLNSTFPPFPVACTAHILYASVFCFPFCTLIAHVHLYCPPSTALFQLFSLRCALGSLPFSPCTPPLHDPTNPLPLSPLHYLVFLHQIYWPPSCGPCESNSVGTSKAQWEHRRFSGNIEGSVETFVVLGR
jgi:hypothetical protein